MHCLLSRKGQAIGGIDTERMVGREADAYTMIAHTHQTADVTRENRFGKRVRIMNAGFSGPQDWVPEWAENALAEQIDYGIRIVTDRGGRVTGSRWVTMADLEDRYCAEADRLLAEGGVR